MKNLITRSIFSVLSILIIIGCKPTAEEKFNSSIDEIFNESFIYSDDSISSALNRIKASILKDYESKGVTENNFLIEDMVPSRVLEKNIEYIAKSIEGSCFIEHGTANSYTLIKLLPNNRFEDETDVNTVYTYGIYSGKYEILKENINALPFIKLIYDNNEPESAVKEKTYQTRTFRILEAKLGDIQELIRSIESDRYRITDPFLLQLKLDQESPLLLVQHIESDYGNVDVCYLKVDESYFQQRTPFDHEKFKAEYEQKKIDMEYEEMYPSDDILLYN